MANIIFKNIKLRNFMSYHEAEVDLQRNGYILVQGCNQNPSDLAESNGSGKSSLFSAILWCLTGETTSGAKEVANIYYPNELTQVCLEFDFDSTSFIVTRTKNPSNLFIEVNGENKSGKGIRDTEKLLREYLPQLSSSLINSVIILGQGLPQKFTNNTPAGRKEVLEHLSNSDFMITDLKEKLAKRHAYLSADISGYESEIIKIDTALDINTLNISKLENELKDLPNGFDLIDEIGRLKTLDIPSHEQEWKAKEVEYKQIKEEVANIQQQFFDAQPQYIDYAKEASDLNQCKINYEIICNELSKLLSADKICPTCGQEMPDTSAEITRLENDKEKVKKNLDNLESLVRQINAKNDALKADFTEKYNKAWKECKDRESIIAQEISDLRYIIDLETKQEQDRENKIYKLQIDLDSLNEKVENNKKSRQELMDEIENLNKDKDRLQKILDETKDSLSVVNKMSTLIKRDFRGYLLSYVINFIDAQAKVYCNDIFNTNNIDFKLDGNNISIKYCNKEYESLSGGEKQKIDIIIQLAIRDMLCRYLNFSSNILVIDEITDALDVLGSKKVFDLISNKLNDVTSIYIISHHAEKLNVPVDDYIKIYKDEYGISSIL